MPATDLTPTVAHVDLGALRHNIRLLQARAAPAPLMGVLKANAYGHGAARVGQVMQEEGITHFAVATVAEAVQLRDAGFTEPILVFAAPLPEFLPAYAAHRLTVTVPSPEVADAVIDRAWRAGPLRVQVKVDTGMGRIGLTPEETPAVVRRLERAAHVELAGLWTHFATADRPGDAFVAAQQARFEALVQEVGDAFPLIHSANSGALLTVRDRLALGRRACARIGIALYGPFDPDPFYEAFDLRPVMRFCTRVTHLKTVAGGTSISYGRRWVAARMSRIATLGAGYADGYPRALTNRGEVGIRGGRYPLVGTICMDMMMTDLGDPDGPGGTVEVGDEVVLFGQGGPSALAVAERLRTIPYELYCRISSRVPRRYQE